MKALILESAGVLKIRDVEEPQAASGETVVSVEVAGLGGSEALALGDPGIRPLPNIMGHGIVATTDDGRRVAVNPLVGCRECHYCRSQTPQLCDQWTLIGVQRPGGLADRVAVPVGSLVELPTDMSWEQAAFIEPFANSVAAWRKATPAPDSRVLVIGAGGLGLGLIGCASGSGTHSPEVLEPSPSRAAAAAQMGANFCTDAETRRFDVVFDTVGSTKTRIHAARLAERGATVVLLGFATPTHEFAFNEMIRNEQHLLGSFVYDAVEFREAVGIAALASGDFVTNIGWTEVAAVLDRFRHGDHSVVKAAFRPNATSPTT